jgi:hypothetical protein
MQIVTCPNPNCGAQLFLSRDRAPKCGRCGTVISVKIAKPGGFFARLRGLFSTTAQSPPRARPTSRGAHDDIESKVLLLAKKSWGSRQDISSAQLVLEPARIAGRLVHAELVGAMLRHVGRVAPALSVPMMTPRIVVEAVCDAAGQFVEEDGWVKIAVNSAFFHNMPAASAILCHELCHYVLSANGIRQTPALENERLTDTAMFVFGLGDIFMAGYKKAPREYRPGHRVGYLTDEEFHFLRGYVPQLRGSEEFLRAAKRADDWRWDRSSR